MAHRHPRQRHIPTAYTGQTGTVAHRAWRALAALLLCLVRSSQEAKLSSGTTPREVLAKFKSLPMVDVHLPSTDGREFTMSRYTQPQAEHRMLLDQLRLTLPDQPLPESTVAQATKATVELALQWGPTGLARVKSTC